MKCGTRVAVGVGAGYLLGRRRKMRLAMMLAAAGATGKFGPAGYRELLNRGVQTLGTSPELGKITETVRGELVDALKTAAVTAATSRVDSLNERLQQGPLRKRSKAEDDGQAEPQDETADDEATDEVDDEATDDEATDEADEEAGDEDEADEEGSDDEDRAEDEEPESDQADDEPEEEPERAAPSRKRTAARSEKSSGRAPVRRVRR
jgi:hypothetical protein